MDQAMSSLKILVGLGLMTAGFPRLVSAIELQPDTLKAWNDYITKADSSLRLDDRRPFLWIDRSPERSARLHRGEILVTPIVGHGTKSVPNGLIHDWIGATFIPNATLEELFAVVHDYARYKEFYKPVVADSKVLACTNTDQRFSMVWQHRVLFIDTAIEGEYEAHDTSLDGRRGYNIANTTQVREFEAYGQSSERLLPPGEGNGFIWRLHSIARYEERDGGVYLELQAIALTRDVPISLRWLVNPVVNHLSINSLTTTLRQTRDAVNATARLPERLASCGAGGRNSRNVKTGSED